MPYWISKSCSSIKIRPGCKEVTREFDIDYHGEQLIISSDEYDLHYRLDFDELLSNPDTDIISGCKYGALCGDDSLILCIMLRCVNTPDPYLTFIVVDFIDCRWHYYKVYDIIERLDSVIVTVEPSRFQVIDDGDVDFFVSDNLKILGDEYEELICCELRTSQQPKNANF